jgi:hypothetical protein
LLGHTESAEAPCDGLEILLHAASHTEIVAKRKRNFFLDVWKTVRYKAEDGRTDRFIQPATKDEDAMKDADHIYRLGIMLEATKLRLATSTFSTSRSILCREAQAIRRQMQEA